MHNRNVIGFSTVEGIMMQLGSVSNSLYQRALLAIVMLTKHSTNPRQVEGSGVVIREDGLILTARHTLFGQERLYASFPNSDDHGLSFKPEEIETIFVSPDCDLALLKIRSPREQKYPIVPLGNTSPETHTTCEKLGSKVA